MTTPRWWKRRFIDIIEHTARSIWKGPDWTVYERRVVERTRAEDRERK